MNWGQNENETDDLNFKLAKGWETKKNLQQETGFKKMKFNICIRGRVLKNVLKKCDD